MTPDAEAHLADLPPGEQSMVLDAIEEQLVHQPTVATRNRKAMQENPLAPWALRGRLRVY